MVSMKQLQDCDHLAFRCKDSSDYYLAQLTKILSLLDICIFSTSLVASVADLDAVLEKYIYLSLSEYFQIN